MSDTPIPTSGDQTYYVYGLIDPRNQLPFYIGKGKDLRAESHLKKVRNGRKSENPRKDRTIKEILDAGLEPSITRFLTDISEIDAWNEESKLIKFYGRVGFEPRGILTNFYDDLITPQNTGRTRFKKGCVPWNKGLTGVQKHSEATKSQMSLSRIGYQNALGSKHSDQSKRNRSEQTRGRKHSELTKAKIRATCKALRLTELNSMGEKHE